MNNKNTIIRLECEKDYRTVENLTREAFWNVYQPGCTEHYVLHCYRSNPDFIPELDFVMETEGIIMGHVMFSKAEILSDDGRVIPILTFGPISIAPAYKRQGYGIRLLKHALEKAQEMGFGAVFVEGNIDFYKHAGFVTASGLGIHYHAEPRESTVPYFLGLELQKGYLKGIEGTYYTPRGYYVAFQDPYGFEKYDSGFPVKDILVLPGQLP
ncbi:MAG: N-acetyltransferase [Bacteroidales bacterium]|jgi:predicted N-acetyltransferase YhbS|nr:N-acetyltransferase [Bacteroidales bacterium]MCI2133110.1 N-acetyltransferase [Bacteroidales bacterium]